ncbi:MAG: adenosylcobinamide-phosphate synthase CbiB [Thermodesulfobacteriota bacterium]
MSLELQIIMALVLDALWGDPRWLPHPVRLMGWLALSCERMTRAIMPYEKLAGIITVILVLAATGLTGWGLIRLAGIFHPVAETVVSVLLLYSCFAGRDLVVHSRKVYAALRDDDLAEARKRVGMIVGRDTTELERSGVVRACVESVAENTVDGVTAPLFWAIIAGPLGAVLYKGVNTMDSTFGYKNERYLHFGWAAARFDDLVNFLPARISGLLTVLAGALLRLRAAESWRIFRRDRLQHASPNAGQTEAPVAGALGISLGGSSSYFGKVVHKPTIGEPVMEPEPEHILQTNRILLMVTLLFFLLLLASRLVVLAILGAG